MPCPQPSGGPRHPAAAAASAPAGGGRSGGGSLVLILRAPSLGRVLHRSEQRRKRVQLLQCRARRKRSTLASSAPLVAPSLSLIDAPSTSNHQAAPCTARQTPCCALPPAGVLRDWTGGAASRAALLVEHLPTLSLT